MDKYRNIIDKIINDYTSDDVELNAEFFDFDVSLSTTELLKAYAELQLTINSDAVIHLKNIKSETMSDGITTITGEPVAVNDEPEGTVYVGNYKQFLESLCGKESNTGWYRLTDVTSGNGRICGTKLDFFL